MASSIEFSEVSDLLELDNPAIVEKDFWVVRLLAQLTTFSLEFHDIVFSGGTALAKSSIDIMRMSEDVDLKLIPIKAFYNLSRSRQKSVRKDAIALVKAGIALDDAFRLRQEQKRDEYRYCEFEIEYPQQFKISPCLRPMIKLELIETELYAPAEVRAIGSMVAKAYSKVIEISQFKCVDINSTLAEKLVSMLRRTASVYRSGERKDDKALVRHIYDVHIISKSIKIDFTLVKSIFEQVIALDKVRFGSQHPEFVANALVELSVGLTMLEGDNKYRIRFDEFVKPMVYNRQLHEFDICFASFKTIALKLLDLASNSK